MQEKRNIQILIETMTRCGGNCSGCALSSVERMETTFDFDNFLSKTKLIRQQLDNVNINETESITIFLGQGDHFLIDNKDISPFMSACSQMIPDILKSKTVVFITASAIGKARHIREKMDLFYDYSVQYQLPFFIQVVFDPKKMKLNKKFQDIYIHNILYFKEKCGMTEVTVNMGEDLLEHMTPVEFHDWIKTYQFKHIEMNWVTNQFTHTMWKRIYKDMYAWLEQWITIYLQDPVYEINFLPFLSRHLLLQDVSLMKMQSRIENSLRDNLYIDYQGNFFPSQMGLISNLTPFGQRVSSISYKNNYVDKYLQDNVQNLTKTIKISSIKHISEHNKDIDKNDLSKNLDYQEQLNILNNKLSRKIISSLLRKEACSQCEFQSVCAISGITPLFDYQDNQNDDECPWNVKSFLIFFKDIMNNKGDEIDRLRENNNSLGSSTFRDITKTIFNKNPVQSSLLINSESKSSNNATSTYFEDSINKTMSSDEKIETKQLIDNNN